MVKQTKLKKDERLKQSLKPTLKSKDFNERLGYNSKPTSSVRNITNDELITKLINI